MSTPRRSHLLTSTLCLTLVVPLAADHVTFEKVLGIIQTKDGDRRLRYKDVDLSFNDDVQRMVVLSKDRPVDVAYEDVVKVIFEPSTDFSGGAWIFGVPTGLGRGAFSTMWCYFEYRSINGQIEPYLLEIDRDHVPEIQRRMQTLFRDRVTVASFDENALSRDIDKDILPDLRSQQDMEANRQDHPMPELRAEQALVVVVTPALRGAPHGKGRQVKIHVGDRVVSVNKYATYGWFYLNPGSYQLVAQAGNANALPISVEAGASYYFLQYASYGDLKTQTRLVRHTKELVMYQLNGAYHSVWSRRE